MVEGELFNHCTKPSPQDTQGHVEYTREKSVTLFGAVFEN